MVTAQHETEIRKKDASYATDVECGVRGDGKRFLHDEERRTRMEQSARQPRRGASSGVRFDIPALIRSMRSLSLAAAVVLATFVVAPSTAFAKNLFTLDAQPASPGHVIEDGAGNAYIAWTHRAGGALADAPMFCKVPAGGACSAPVTLAVPGATGGVDGVAAAFPVFGPGSTLYVVAPRYIRDDVVVWTSTDGGQSFDAGTITPGGYSNKTNPSNVILSGSNLLVSAHNAGLGFSSTPVGGGSGGNFSFTDPGAGGVAGSSMALDGAGNPVEAYWNISSPYQVLFYRYSGIGPLTAESSWVGPTLVTNGYESKVAGGPSGLFLVSQDYQGGKADPGVLHVRKYTGTTFGAPVTLANDKSVNLFAGGAIAESPGGRLAVAWPATGIGQSSVMRLFTSTNGGAGFTELDVANIGSAYALDDNAQLAVGDSGKGWLTFSDATGLRVADLSVVASPTYKGPTKTISEPVGSNDLTLRLPKSCLGSAQPFYVGVGKRARRHVAKSLRGKINVKKVTFFFDGKKRKTLKKKPFRYLLKPGPLASGSTHTVKTRVTAIVRRHGHKKLVVRTLKGQIKIC